MFFHKNLFTLEELNSLESLGDKVIQDYDKNSYIKGKIIAEENGLKRNLDYLAYHL